ncbi:hypothetical protein Micbo1qcDRAFT_169925 [Microdochium bolleyi]|uniref:Uncharacterized protein n=1 Tax=Microdochium bolleyi TaxID=196109 RepID=A0A136IIM0_9PEZI|nr:hypothetical protein Micbo1qcDRAFT_169925 [Microdochium bolleyi]
MIQKHHFPPEWSVSQMQQKPVVAEQTAEEASLFVESDDSAETETIEYPWATLETADGSRILGVRPRGKVGLQVCVETMKDGRVVRRLMPASQVPEVTQYIKKDGYKNLAEGQSTWTYKQRGDFEELLWVTDPAHPRSEKRDPPADCCVRFRGQGLQILTRTSLFKVLGEKKARAEMESVCARDGIPAPWQMKPREQSAIKKEDTNVDMHHVPKHGGYSQDQSDVLSHMQARLEENEKKTSEALAQMEARLERNDGTMSKFQSTLDLILAKLNAM